MIAQWPVQLLDQLPRRFIKDIQAALGHGFGERNFKDITDEIQEGSKQIWMHSTDEAFNATVITQIIEHPRKKTCEVVCLGGEEAEKFLDEIKVIEEWAKLNNCDDIQVIGRRGWARALKSQDYTDRYTTIGKMLT